MGHQLSTALSRCACGPCIPGEFDFVPGYTRLPPMNECQPSSPSQPSRGSSMAASEEALLSHRTSRTKSMGDRQQLYAAVRSSPLFKDVGADRLKDLVDSMEYLEFRLGEAVVAEGCVSNYFYVAHTSGLDKVLCGGMVSALIPGQVFGEAALLSKCPQSCSVVATKPKVGLWAGEASRFREVVLDAIQKKNDEIRVFLGQVTTLQALSVRQLDCVADMASVQTYEVGELPIRRGAEISQASFLKSGKLRRIGSQETMSVGSCVGERLLFYGDTSGYPIEVTERCELVHVNARKLRQLVGKSAAAVKLQQGLVLSSLEKSGLLASWTPSQRASTAFSMELSEFMPGARIPASISLFVVLDGDVQLGTFPSVRTLRSGDVEGSLGAGINDTPSHSPAHHRAPLFAGHLGCRLAVLPSSRAGSRDDGDDDEDGIRNRMLLLSKVSVFCSLGKAQLSSVAGLAVSSAHHCEEVIVTQGDCASMFFVLAAGELDVIRDGRVVRRMAHPACFGERALISDELWATTLRVASREAEVWTWERNGLMQILADSPASKQIVQRAGLQDCGILLRDLWRCGKLGCGTSATVWLVNHKPTNARYALKQLGKSDGEVSKEVRREIDVLSANDHPFLLHMVKAFETPTNVYVLSECVGGGELHAAMRTISTVFTRPQAMFYVGSLLLVIASLHERGVVYRDLKPENVMLDTEGYVKLIDFGTAKKLGEVSGRTFTMVGTTHYMAPDLLRGKGYGLEVDVWALGIILYELTCGHLPFGENAESEKEVWKAILSSSPTLPQDLDACTSQLIAGLLEPRPRRRFGCGTSGLEEIKTCSFFKDSENVKCNGSEPHEVDYFDKLLSRRLKAPIKPGELFTVEADGEPITDAEDVLPEGVEACEVNRERRRSATEIPNS